jgi:hypothetical protein
MEASTAGRTSMAEKKKKGHAKARDFGGHMVDGSIVWMFDVLGLIL